MSARLVAAFAGLVLVAGTAAASGHAMQASSAPQVAETTPPSLVDLYAHTAPAMAAESATDGLPVELIGADAAAAGDAPSTDGAPAGGGAGTGGGGSGGSTPGGGATPLGGFEWRSADIAEVKRAVAAHRSAAGLAAFVTPYGNCVDRVVAVSGTGFGISPSQTYGQNLVANYSSQLRATPLSGGVMAASFSANDVTDRSGTLRPGQIAAVKVVECGIPTPTSPDVTHVYPPAPSPPPPAPTPPASDPVPSVEPVEPVSGE